MTGRNDGEILLSDSPLTEEHLLEQTRAPSDLTPFEAEQWIPGALSDMRESWLSQMKMEVDIVNFIVDTGDLIWPLAIICLWAYSIYEGIRIFSGNEEKSSQSSLSMALKMGVQAVYSPFESIGQRWSKLDRNHEIMVRSQKNKLQNLLSRYGSKLDTSNRIRELLGSLMDKLKVPKNSKEDLRLWEDKAIWGQIFYSMASYWY